MGVGVEMEGVGGSDETSRTLQLVEKNPPMVLLKKKLRREVPALNFNLNGSGAKSTKPKPKFYSVMRPIELITMMFLQDSIVREETKF